VSAHERTARSKRRLAVECLLGRADVVFPHGGGAAQNDGSGRRGRRASDRTSKRAVPAAALGGGPNAGEQSDKRAR